MREIKFRAWVKDEKLMLYDIHLRYEHKDSSGKEYDGYEDWTFSDFLADKRIVVMQYIGRKDKNRKEIYVDDIVINHYLKRNGAKEFEYIQHIELTDISYVDLEHKELEVIGNICENPELLK